MGKRANKGQRGRDRFQVLAKEMGYRSRASFKLVSLNNMHGDFLRSAKTLIDLCAAPGGWLQVAAKYMPSGSTIIGVDLAAIKPIRGVITHKEDITTPECRTLLKRDLNGKKADVVLHDGAPNMGQNWQKDAYTQSELVLHSLKLATEFLRPRGIFITKIFRSSDYNSLLWVFHQLFDKVAASKPASSRMASAEIFVTCTGYKAPDKIDPRLLDARYVFKEVSDGVGTATGLAGGGGGGAVDVLHKKGHDKKVRQRDGYDPSLGPLLTRVLPVSAFIRSAEPVRVLTDASGFAFDAEAAALGYTGHPSTTEDVRSACADLKVLGKKEFKELLKWRLTLRRALPETLVRRRAPKEGEEGEGGGDGSGSESGSDDASSDASSEEDDADARELSSAAAAELRRRKREKKRAARVRAKTAQRARLGMNLRSVDIAATEGEGLFDLATVRRLAARADADGDGTGAAVLDALVADVDLDDARLPGSAAGVGTVHAPLGYDDSDDDVPDDRSDIDLGDGDDEGAGAGDDEAAADDDSDDEGGVLARLRDADATARMDELEEDMDRAYAVFLAKRESRAAQAASRVEAGQASAGIKLSRRAKLEQQALVTQAALEGKIDAEHAKYLKLLGGARAAAEAGAAATAAAPSRKRRRGEEGVDSDDGADDISDDSDDYEEAEDVEAGSDGGDGDSDDDALPTAPAPIPAPAPLSGKASRWYAQPLFAGALGAGAVAAGGDAAAALSLAAPGARKAAKAAAAARTAAAGSDDDPLSSDDDGDAEADVAAARKAAAAKKGVKGARAAAAAAKRTAAAAAGDADAAMGVDSDGDIDPLAHLPKTDRERWKEKLKKRRERVEAAAARRAKKDSFQVVEGAEDAGDDEFASAVARAGGRAPAGGSDDEGGAAPAAGSKRKRGVRFDDAAGGDDDSVNGGESDGEGGVAPLDPRVKAKRDLIRRGMGAALGATDDGAAAGATGGKAKKGRDLKKAGSGFDVVPGGDAGDDEDDGGADDDAASADSGPDPRDADYDSDTHAELLALGKMLKRHTTAKALADASYNRYAFDDAGELPAWFKHDEARHFKPQLPISKADVERLKSHFRDIAARPIAKVAEARARKRRRVSDKLEKAKKQAESILDTEEMGGRSKARAIRRVYRQAEASKKRKVVYAVHTNQSGKSMRAKGGSGGGGGTVVKHVDGRMKKEKRAMKRKGKKGGGRR